MIKLDKAIIVEGKYDKIKLANFIDAPIIPTFGFSIFKDKEKRALIKRLANEKGIVVLTDSDSAGAIIRSHIKSIVDNGEIINVYIPQIKGKESRKPKKGKEGLLGVEGISESILLDCFKKSGLTAETKKEKAEKITKTDLFSIGISGTENSAKNRKSLLDFLNLPKNLTANGMLDMLNTFYSKKEFFNEVEKWQNEKVKK